VSYGQEQVDTISGPRLTAAAVQQLKERYTVLPYKGGLSSGAIAAQAAAATTIPLFNAKVVDGARTFTYKMVGKSPFVHQAAPVVNIPTFLIPVKWVFTDQGNATFDPNVNSACAGGIPTTLAKNSPVLAPPANNVTVAGVGKGQITSLFQRANFFKFTKPGAINAGLQVNLSPVKVLPTINLAATGGSIFSGLPCGNNNHQVGAFDLGSWDAFAQGKITGSLKAQGVTPRSLPIFLFYNVVLTSGGCCVLGYHSAMNNSAFGGAFQTYSIANYDGSKAFTNDGTIIDTSPLSHEIAEWMDDPSGTNPTKPWGNIGQVTGCQNNLEVGDPLSGTTKVFALGGHNYHIQDEAFESWFYHRVPSIGLAGKYSFFGTFTGNAKPCPPGGTN